MSTIDLCIGFLPEYSLERGGWLEADRISYDKPFTSEADASLTVVFSNLVAEWKTASSGSSSIARRYAHPSYQAILALGADAVPLILRELREHPDYWFAALRALTKRNAVDPNASFDEAVKGWISWGIAHGYLD